MMTGIGRGNTSTTQAVAGLSQLQLGVAHWATSVALPTEVVANLPHK